MKKSKKVKVGDIVSFNNMSLMENLDLADRLMCSYKKKYEVIEVDKDKKEFWIENCEYPVSFDECFEITKKEYVYVVTTCITNMEEETETVNSIIQVTSNVNFAKDTMEDLVFEVTNNYEKNNFAFNIDKSGDDILDEESEQESIMIIREDLLETVVIDITRKELE